MDSWLVMSGRWWPPVARAPLRARQKVQCFTYNGNEQEQYTVTIRQSGNSTGRKPRCIMSHGWNTTILTSEEDVLWLLLDLQGKCWLSRGHSQCRDSLVPSIDRDGLKGLHGPRSYSVNAGASTSFGQRRASLLAGEKKEPSSMTLSR